jgi:hypothetical protein
MPREPLHQPGGQQGGRGLHLVSPDRQALGALGTSGYGHHSTWEVKLFQCHLSYLLLEVGSAIRGSLPWWQRGPETQ